MPLVYRISPTTLFYRNIKNIYTYNIGYVYMYNNICCVYVKHIYMLNETPSAFLYKKIVIPATLSFCVRTSRIYTMLVIQARIYTQVPYIAYVCHTTAHVYISQRKHYMCIVNFGYAMVREWNRCRVVNV